MKELETALNNLKLKLKSGMGIDSIEKTKQWAVLPFLVYMGYNILSDDVTPCYMDIKGGLNTYDYVLKVDGTPVIVVKCKKMGEMVKDVDIDLLDAGFVETKAELGIITDGLNYYFYCPESNKEHIEKVHYYKFCINKHNDLDVKRIYKYCKDNVLKQGIYDYTDIEKYESECDEFIENIFRCESPDWLITLLSRKSGVHSVESDTLKNIMNDKLQKKIEDMQDKIYASTAQKGANASIEIDASLERLSCTHDLVKLASDELKHVSITRFKFVNLLGKTLKANNTSRLLDVIMIELIEAGLTTCEKIVELSRESEAGSLRITNYAIGRSNRRIKGTELYKNYRANYADVLNFARKLVKSCGMSDSDVIVGLYKA